MPPPILRPERVRRSAARGARRAVIKMILDDKSIGNTTDPVILEIIAGKAVADRLIATRTTTLEHAYGKPSQHSIVTLAYMHDEISTEEYKAAMTYFMHATDEYLRRRYEEKRS